MTTPEEIAEDIFRQVWRMVLHSPTALSALELCARKYAFDKVDKVPREPPNPYAEFGIEVHRLIEQYYRAGVMPDIREPEGDCAIALLSHLPPPQDGMVIEAEHVLAPFHGYLDLRVGNLVWDHKTTSDHKWAKSPDDLKRDLQACLYASFAMHASGERTATLQWNYVTRKKPRVLPVVAHMTTADLEPTLDRALTLAAQADTILARQIPALELPPNPSACEAFGGCPHRQRCNLTPSQRMQGWLDMTTAADFLAKMNASHPPTPAAAPTAPADPTAGWTRANGHRLNPATNAWEPDVQAAPPPPPAPAPPPPVAAIPINPPPPAAPPAVPVWTPPPVQAAPAAPAPTPPAPDAPETPYERLAQALEMAADALREMGGAPAKRKPGRPRKAEM